MTPLVPSRPVEKKSIGGRATRPITLTYLGIVGVLLSKVWFSKKRFT